MSDTQVLEPTPATPAKPKRVSFAHRLWTGEISYNFVGHSRWFYMISAVLILVSIVSLLVRGLDLGIEFRGGSNFTVSVANVTSTTLDDFRTAVIDSGVPNLDVTVATIGSGRVSIETRALDVDEQITVREAIAEKAGTTAEKVDYQQIGASWGKQVTRQAAIALVVFLILVAFLMGIYFRDWKMALSALVALLHDMIITVGIYALVGFTVTPATLTGLLTILGYSLYDTVVVFDKVRENTANLDEYKSTYAEAANHSVNQVLVRSINTTVIGVLPVAAILFAGAFILGSGPLEDIGLALFVGMIIGAYSSIFIATPLLTHLRMGEPGMQQQAMRVAKRREKLAKAEAAVKAAPAEPVFTIETTSTSSGESFTRQQPVKTARSKRVKSS
ncbi:MAG: protein translocase subunit SecF [Propionibacteriaceae bacterium]|nr:protein translocase subunit SecF [Propionibacteriaceae bacterium]